MVKKYIEDKVKAGYERKFKILETSQNLATYFLSQWNNLEVMTDQEITLTNITKKIKTDNPLENDRAVINDSVYKRVLVLERLYGKCGLYGSYPDYESLIAFNLDEDAHWANNFIDRFPKRQIREDEYKAVYEGTHSFLCGLINRIWKFKDSNLKEYKQSLKKTLGDLQKHGVNIRDLPEIKEVSPIPLDKFRYERIQSRRNERRKI